MQSLWDLAETARFLNVSQAVLRKRSVVTGEIPHFRIGAKIRFSPDQIRAWLDKQSSARVAGLKAEEMQ